MNSNTPHVFAAADPSSRPDRSRLAATWSITFASGLVAATFLGWLFTGAYYWKSSGPFDAFVDAQFAFLSKWEPRTVVEALLLLIVLFGTAALPVVRRLPRHGSVRRVPSLLVATAPLLIAPLFWISAVTTRSLAEDGRLDYTGFSRTTIDGKPALESDIAEGETVFLGGREYTRTRHGFGVKNLTDSRSATELIQAAATGAWSHLPMLPLAAAVSLMTAIAALAHVMRRPPGSQ
jgi:hypothetical protein